MNKKFVVIAVALMGVAMAITSRTTRAACNPPDGTRICYFRNLRPKYVELPELGLQIEYSEIAPEEATPDVTIVGMHGLTDAWLSYARLMYEMVHVQKLNVRFVSLSLPCHGGSTKNTSCIYEKDLVAEVIDEFMAVKGIVNTASHKVILVGHSMSSLLSTHVAFKKPELIDGLVLLGPMAALAVSPDGNDLCGFIQSLIIPELDAEATYDYQFCNDWQSSTVASPATLPFWFFDGCIKETMRVPYKCWAAAVSMLCASDVRTESQSVSADVFLIHGDFDIVPTGEGSGGFDDFKFPAEHLTLVNIPAFDHAPHWSDPATLSTMIAEHYAIPTYN